MPVAVAAVALTAGVAVATFVKAFGIGFLARPRSAAAAARTSSPPACSPGWGWPRLACVVLALVPATVVPASAVRSRAAEPRGPAGGRGGAVTPRRPGRESPAALSPAVGRRAAGCGRRVWSSSLGRLRVAASAVARGQAAARRAVRLWDCGGGPLTARMEYTATSFAEPLQRVFDDVLAPETDLDITHLDEARYLVASAEYRRQVPDRIERRLYEPVLAAVGAWGDAARRLAHRQRAPLPGLRLLRGHRAADRAGGDPVNAAWRCAGGRRSRPCS